MLWQYQFRQFLLQGREGGVSGGGGLHRCGRGGTSSGVPGGEMEEGGVEHAVQRHDRRTRHTDRQVARLPRHRATYLRTDDGGHRGGAAPGCEKHRRELRTQDDCHHQGHDTLFAEHET